VPSVLVLNGPNLNLLGTRQPELYGRATLADVEATCRAAAAERGLDVDFLQSNHEGVLVDAVHDARGRFDGLVLNPGGLGHTSVVLLDALTAVGLPLVEVHVTNIHRREQFRRHSYVSLAADGVVAGCGIQGYAFAVHRLATLFEETP